MKIFELKRGGIGFINKIQKKYKKELEEKGLKESVLIEMISNDKTLILINMGGNSFILDVKIAKTIEVIKV